MPKLLSALIALLTLSLAACNSSKPAPSRTFDSERPAIEVRPGKASQERGAKEFLFQGRPVFLGEASYFQVAEAAPTTDQNGNPAVAILFAESEKQAIADWRRQYVGEVAAILLEGHVLLTGIVQPGAEGPFVLDGGRNGLTRSEVDFLVKLLNGQY